MSRWSDTFLSRSWPQVCLLTALLTFLWSQDPKYSPRVGSLIPKCLSKPFWPNFYPNSGSGLVKKKFTFSAHWALGVANWLKCSWIFGIRPTMLSPIGLGVCAHSDNFYPTPDAQVCPSLLPMFSLSVFPTSSKLGEVTGALTSMESRTVKPQNQLPNILRPSMPRHVSVIDYFKIARTPEILSIYPFCKQL